MAKDRERVCEHYMYHGCCKSIQIVNVDITKSVRNARTIVH